MSSGKNALHVLCVGFHHRNGPQVEYVHPPFPKADSTDTETNSPNSASASVEIPEEWSFLPFVSLPDGAHANEKEFTYFHLPPIPRLNINTNVFGLACFRQIETDSLLAKDASMTRSKVQKAVIVLSAEPVSFAVKSKLDLITTSFFNQRDFTNTSILQDFYGYLQQKSHTLPLSDKSMGLPLAKFFQTFKHKSLQLFKLMLLEKKILFYGRRVENLALNQYCLVSLVPHLLENLKVAVRGGESFHNRIDPADLLRFKGLPLCLFHKESFFQPYIALQELHTLQDAGLKAFIVGTTNSVIVQNLALGFDAIANLKKVDTGAVEFRNPALPPWVALSSADRVFIEAIVTSTQGGGGESPESEGVPDVENEDNEVYWKIYKDFEEYLLTAMNTVQQYSRNPKDERVYGLISDYNPNWVQEWEKSFNFLTWNDYWSVNKVEYSGLGHPKAGSSALSELQSVVSSRLGDLKKSMTPIQQNLGKAMAPLQQNVGRALTSAESTISSAISTVRDPETHQYIQATASSMFASMSSWYTERKKDVTTFLNQNLSNLGEPSTAAENDLDSPYVDVAGEEIWKEDEEAVRNSEETPKVEDLSIAGKVSDAPKSVEASEGAAEVAKLKENDDAVKE
ncbi:late secretory pathway protein avl9 [Phlyctochytrium planicorne]|nr:late secretory pathway protein avl9 [Phlyctochytrium planicorne]